jgi:hypothetical protein
MATQMEAWRSVLDDHVGPECLHLLVASDLLLFLARVSSGLPIARWSMTIPS